jgi:hypothetical protein
MPSLEPTDFSQPNNKLSDYANAERGKLFPKNDYKKLTFEYTSTNPDAMADGDEKGKGTGIFLDVYNEKAGSKTDVTERKKEIAINIYNKNKFYTVPK